MGFTSYYHYFVRNFSSIATHLTNLTKKRYRLNGPKNVKGASKILRLFFTMCPFYHYQLRVRTLLFIVMLHILDWVLC